MVVRAWYRARRAATPRDHVLKAPNRGLPAGAGLTPISNILDTESTMKEIAPPTPALRIRRLHTLDPDALQQLADVLVDCVEGGASVSFMLPLERPRALAFWQGVAASAARGERVLLVAEDAAGICGTVQLVVDLPENQPHRAEVSKMLVHRRARCRGLGAALMQAVESEAQSLGKTLLVLDTASAEAERLYERQGWVRCGSIPGFALLPGGGLCATTLFYRSQAAGPISRP
jgi:GNAT superfamily N-acetyltransferase